MLAPGEAASIERDVFPRLVGEGLYARAGDGYWLDIGTPERYLEATFDILEGTVDTPVARRLGERFVCVEDGVDNAGRIVPSALIERGCRIDAGARIGGRVVLEGGVVVGRDAIVEQAVVMAGAEIGDGCVLRSCIVGPGVTVGAGTHVEGLAVLGKDVAVGADNQLM